MRRRMFLIGAGAFAASPALARAPFGGEALRAEIGRLEAASRGRMGVAILDTATGARFAWRGDERFPMCSTFKALLAGAILARVDAGRERLDAAVPVSRADLVAYAPFAETRVGGTATVAELCAATVGQSDNAAANLLLARIGGPAGLTRFLRATGDRVTRLDRTEPALNTSLPGDPRDTTSPRALAEMLRRLTLGGVLTTASRALLVAWMVAAMTGGKRLRAGLPSGWRVADKTGTGERGANNVVALLWPLRRPGPLVVASYLLAPSLSPAERDAVHASLARAIAAEMPRPA